MNSLISLSDLPVGENAIIQSFHVGRAEGNRLVSLGFTPGVKVNIAQNFGRGPMIVKIRGTQVALGRLEAGRIFVEKIPHG
jgi:ferrous iron transport protein A